MSKRKKVFLQIQYFHGCPNTPEMIRRVKEAINGIEDNVDYKEILIGTTELAEKFKFRGSPTLLINGEDFEGRVKPDEASLNCRYYQNGLPSIEEIKVKIQNAN